MARKGFLLVLASSLLPVLAWADVRGCSVADNSGFALPLGMLAIGVAALVYNLRRR